jgi:N6-L-threonylcarbamoyladenine synthase
MNTVILGLESSCDETAASIVVDGVTVHSSIIATQHDLHAAFRGVVPEVASRAHLERLWPVISQALSDASCTLKELDAIAVSTAPGLIGSLLVTVSAAKALSWSLDRPLIAVNHVLAHLYAPTLATGPITYPALGVVVSGGHTQLMHVTSPTSAVVIGATIDDAIGEAFDKVATILDLGYPGGPAIDRLAQHGDPHAYDLPIARLSPESLDFSFSGLKTAVKYAACGVPAKGESVPQTATDLSDQTRADLAASFQRAAIDAIMLKMTRAIQKNTVGSLVVGGGVCANSLLRTRLGEFAGANGLELHIPPIDLCLDNAAMIAGLAWHHLQRGEIAPLDVSPMTRAEYA